MLITVVPPSLPPSQMERLLCSGLLGEGEIVRLNAIQRAEPPPSIAAFCEDTDNAHIAARSDVQL